MAKRNTRKQPEEPQINIGAEIFESLEELEKIKGIPVEDMLKKLEQALTIAYRGGNKRDKNKDRDKDKEKEEPASSNVVVKITREGLSMYAMKTVVEEVKDPTQEILLDAARNIREDAQVGEQVRVDIDVSKFGRIAAQTAKQVVVQGIREAEKSRTRNEYNGKWAKLVLGKVDRVEPNGDVILTVTQEGTTNTAILPASEQIPGEEYRVGELVRACVIGVENMREESLVKVSRTHSNMIRRLFEKETPEIADGSVEICNVIREPGSRSKMAVRAKVEGIDPVGACVGSHGDRVAAVVKELSGEKIDIVVWSEDPCEYVKAAISPAKVLSVIPMTGQKGCYVIVDKEQQSLAIGKEGQNARLAARLTGQKIDVKAVTDWNGETEKHQTVEEEN